MPRRRSFFRKPSLRGRFAARTSWKRYVRQSLGFKAPRGWGWVTNPKKAAYNRFYNRTSVGCAALPLFLLVLASWTLGHFASADRPNLCSNTSLRAAIPKPPKHARSATYR